MKGFNPAILGAVVVAMATTVRVVEHNNIFSDTLLMDVFTIIMLFFVLLIVLEIFNIKK